MHDQPNIIIHPNRPEILIQSPSELLARSQYAESDLATVRNDNLFQHNLSVTKHRQRLLPEHCSRLPERSADNEQHLSEFDRCAVFDLYRQYAACNLASERKIFAMLGGEVGALSDIAAADAVDFDSSLQALERDFQAVAGIVHGLSTCGADVAGDLADKVSATLDDLSVNLNSIINDAYGGEPIPESTRKMIQEIQSS